MDEKQLKSLNRVLAYLWDDEFKDYCNQLSEQDRKDHIFTDMRILQDYLNGRKGVKRSLHEILVIYV